MASSLSEIEFSREVFLETLHGILSPDQETKQAAENKIRELESQATDEFGIHLVDYVVYSNDPEALREVAAEFLKQYIESHWNNSGRFQHPVIGCESKIKIKELLPIGLNRSSNKVRKAVADSISVIACSNWPDNWPVLFDTLISNLSNPEYEPVILGTMRVLNTFIKDLTHTQLLNVSPVILREMYRIFKDNNYSVDIRAWAVSKFAEMITTVSAYKQPDLIQQCLQPSITIFCEQFVQSDLKSDTRLRCEIIKAIQELIKTLPKCILDFLPKLLPLIWKALIDSAKVYQECTVNLTQIIDDEDTGVEEVTGFVKLAMTIFELISILMSGSDEHTLVFPEYNLLDYHWFHLQDSLPPEVLQHLIIFIQITNKQIEQWTDGLNRFIIEENLTENSSYPHSTRSKAQELLMKIVHRPERAAANALCDVILKQIETGNAMRIDTNSEVNENWWKLHEASIQVFGLVKDILSEKQQAGTLSFDVAAFLEKVVLVNLNNSENHPLLLARCVYIGGLYAEQMPIEMKSRFLQSTINSLKNQPACTGICAAKAINCWLRSALDNGNNSDNNILRPHLPALFQELFNLGNQFMSVEVLTIVLENFATLASLDKAFTVSVESKISTLAIAAFVNFHRNCLILGICHKVFKELTLNLGCVELLQTHLVPTVVGKLTVHPSKESEDEEFQVDTLEVLILLVQHSPRPLSNFLIRSAFPATCRFIFESDKYSILLKAGKVIRTYVSVAPEQVIGYRDNDGNTGPQYILRVATHLLNFQNGNLLAEDACEIVILLIRKTGSAFSENVDQLLRAVFSRMQRVLVRTCVRKLLMVYAHLINTDFEAVFKFLSTAKGPNEQCAFAFVISDGFCKEHESFNPDDRRTVTLALSKILEHSVTRQDSRLHQINFHGAEGDAESAIPLLVGISKLISNQLSLDTHKSS